MCVCVFVWWNVLYSLTPVNEPGSLLQQFPSVSSCSPPQYLSHLTPRPFRSINKQTRHSPANKPTPSSRPPVRSPLNRQEATNKKTQPLLNLSLILQQIKRPPSLPIRSFCKIEKRRRKTQGMQVVVYEKTKTTSYPCLCLPGPLWIAGMAGSSFLWNR